jgi:hypothetical protein
MDGEICDCYPDRAMAGRNHLPLAGSSWARNQTRLHGPCSKAMPGDEPVRDRRPGSTAPVRARAAAYGHVWIRFFFSTVPRRDMSMKEVLELFLA